jgi:UDP-N-acetylglucosamine transferase subunit ALG13
LIFVALGTHEQPFSRAIEMIKPLTERDDLVIQHGETPTDETFQRTTWMKFVEYERIRNLIAESTHVVCHAGVGLIMTSLLAGKRPIVIPRLARYGEHVDDHQFQIAREFANAGRVVLLTDDDDVAAALERADAPLVSTQPATDLSQHVWRRLDLGDASPE